MASNDLNQEISPIETRYSLLNSAVTLSLDKLAGLFR